MSYHQGGHHNNSNNNQRYSASTTNGYDPNEPPVYRSRPKQPHHYINSNSGSGGYPDYGSTNPEDGKANLYISNMPLTTTDSDLRLLFQPYGPILRVKVPIDKNTGTSSGYGFVLYANDLAAASAIQHLNGHTIGDRRIKVTVANHGSASSAPPPASAAYGTSELKWNIRIDPSVKSNLYVSRLPHDFKATDLAELGAPYGQLAAVRVLPAKDHYQRDRDGNPIMSRATGCIGFLLYTTNEAARIAVDALDGVVPRRDAEPMQVKWAKNCMDESTKADMIKRKAAQQAAANQQSIAAPLPELPPSLAGGIVVKDSKGMTTVYNPVSGEPTHVYDYASGTYLPYATAAAAMAAQSVAPPAQWIGALAGGLQPPPQQPSSAAAVALPSVLSYTVPLPSPTIVSPAASAAAASVERSSSMSSSSMGSSSSSTSSSSSSSSSSASAPTSFAISANAPTSPNHPSDASSSSSPSLSSSRQHSPVPVSPISESSSQGASQQPLSPKPVNHSGSNGNISNSPNGSVASASVPSGSPAPSPHQQNGHGHGQRNYESHHNNNGRNNAISPMPPPSPSPQIPMMSMSSLPPVSPTSSISSVSSMLTPPFGPMGTPPVIATNVVTPNGYPPVASYRYDMPPAPVAPTHQLPYGTPAGQPVVYMSGPPPAQYGGYPPPGATVVYYVQGPPPAGATPMPPPHVQAMPLATQPVVAVHSGAGSYGAHRTYDNHAHDTSNRYNPMARTSSAPHMPSIMHTIPPLGQPPRGY